MIALRVMKNLIKNIQNFSFQNALWKKGDRLVLGVSGGPDSACLLDILAKLAPKSGLELLIAHVNYGLRGKDSDRDEKFVRKLAEKYGIKIELLNHKTEGKTDENTLRDVRYAFFEKVRKENKFDLVAVAHSQDDQAETVLLHLIRGAGMKGLSGMRAKNDRVIRPLLETSRKEILEYLQINALTCRTDKTNRADLFLRNKIRNQLIPYIEKRFNPNIQETLAESALSIADDNRLLDHSAQEYFQKKYHLSAQKLLSLDTALQRRVLLLAIQEQKGDLKNISLSHIQELLKALKSTKNKNQAVLFQGLKLTRKGDRVVLSQK